MVIDNPHDWDMAVLRESPWYQEILQQGEQRGEQRGLIQGKQQGRREEAATLILRQLAYRFGPLPIPSTNRIEQLSLEQLETLSVAWLDFQSVADLDAWLTGQEW